MLRLKPGKLLFPLLALLSLNACRDSQPPAIEICIIDGSGGGDCIEADGSKLFRPPSQMMNYWATSQPDMQNFSSWCYDTNSSAVQTRMTEIQEQAQE